MSVEVGRQFDFSSSVLLGLLEPRLQHVDCNTLHLVVSREVQLQDLNSRECLQPDDRLMKHALLV